MRRRTKWPRSSWPGAGRQASASGAGSSWAGGPEGSRGGRPAVAVADRGLDRLVAWHRAHDHAAVVEQRRDQPVFEEPFVAAAAGTGGLRHGKRLQRPVHEKPRVPFDVARVVAV